MYEIHTGASTADRLTVKGAHPRARVLRDPLAYERARARLFPDG